MKKCRHPRSEQWERRENILRADDRSDMLVRRYCDRCGARLSLGPSNDEPEQVKVEMRAAELAESLNANAHDNERFIALTSFGERRGWAMHRAEERNYVEWGAHPDRHGQAGYLARCIATHKDQP